MVSEVYPEWCESEKRCLQPGKMHPDDIHWASNYICELMEVVDSRVPLPLEDFDWEILAILGYATRMRDYRDKQQEIETVWGPPKKKGTGNAKLVLPKVKK